MAHKSEFGRGYATCLRMFLNHSKRLTEYLEDYSALRNPPMPDYPDFYSERHAVDMWANGASDHLYQLVRPRRGYTAQDWKDAQYVAARALDIGHGFRKESASTEREARELLAMAATLLDRLERKGYATGTVDDAMSTDRRLGLAPDSGEWGCSEDIGRRKRA